MAELGCAVTHGIALYKSTFNYYILLNQCVRSERCGTAHLPSQALRSRLRCTCVHWLRVPERIQFKIAVLTYRVSMVTHHGTWGRSPLLLMSLVDGHCVLLVPSVRLSTVGSRAFPVAAAQIWNFLPEHVVAATTLQSFRRHWKTFLLQQSFCL